MKKTDVNVSVNDFTNYEDYFKEYNKGIGLLNVHSTMDTAKRILESNKVHKNDKWLYTKIENHVNRFSVGTTKDYLISTSTNSEIASLFSKNPQNQNVSEYTQLEYLRKEGIKVKNLGNSAMKLEGVLKTIDFVINDSNDESWLTVAKVTWQMGGHQSNVIDEIKDTLKVVSKNHLDKKFLFLLDGDTWYNYGNVMKNELKKFETDRIIVTTSDEIASYKL